jgi:Holliday junction resolvase
MSNKSKGIRFEREVKKYFQIKGCFVVRQSASQFPDLIVFYPKDYNGNKVLAVECKQNGYLSQNEKVALQKLHSNYGLMPILASKIKGKLHLTLIK